MPNPIYPGGEWIPGRVNAGYVAGRTPVQTVVCHYTVGRDSSGPGYLGRYFQFLVTRGEGGGAARVLQGAETDAVCWHAGSPWNSRGPGIECEFLPGFDDELWTPAQEDATGALCDWLRSEWGVPGDFYDGPRITDWQGFITHRSLIQSGDAHSDWWPYLPTGTPTPTPPPVTEDDAMRLFHDTDADEWWLITSIGWSKITPDEAFAYAAAGIPQGQGSTVTLHALTDRLGEQLAAFAARL